MSDFIRQWPDPALEKQMLSDAGFLDAYGINIDRDCACHIRALLSRIHDLQMEVDRLTPYYDAIASMAAQFVHPKTTPQQLMEDILRNPQQGED